MMARVEVSRWDLDVKNTLTYPECPFMENFSESFRDGYCSIKHPVFGKMWCGTRHEGNPLFACPFGEQQQGVSEG